MSNKWIVRCKVSCTHMMTLLYSLVKIERQELKILNLSPCLPKIIKYRLEFFQSAIGTELAKKESNCWKV